MSYTKKIFSTGAVRKTPARVIDRIIKEIEPKGNTRVIEIGAGKGEITLPLKLKLEQNSEKIEQVFAFEIDSTFSKELENQASPVKIVTASAFDMSSHLPSGFRADYIISSMPVSFYEKVRIKNLIEQMNSMLDEGGKILLLYHAFWWSRFLKSCLPGSKIVSFATVPPYLLLVYSKK